MINNPVANQTSPKANGRPEDDTLVLPSSNSENTVKAVFDDALGANNDKVNWLDESTCEYAGIPDMNLHKAVLQAQEMGKEVTILRKTIVKISE
ncbi:MAG: hypothetical protein MRZ79_12680 [Bacteroidia bacterium]|nr:hypothetical protein [Bacteroidia bacterium]